jgi:transposase InsO family protein
VSGSRVVESSDPLTQLIGKRCESSLLVDGISTVGLLDSGSQISTISEGFYSQYMSSKPLQLLSSIVNIEGGNGQSIPYLGYIEATIQLDGSAAESPEASTLLFVCPDTGYSSQVPLLIGTNVLNRLLNSQSTSDLSTQLLSMQHSIRRQESFCEPGTGSLGAVTALCRRAIHVKPGDTVWVSGMAHTKPVDKPYPALVDAPEDHSSLPVGALVNSALVTMSGRSRCKVKVPICNMTKRVVTICHRAELAQLYLPKWIRPIGTETHCDGDVTVQSKAGVSGTESVDKSFMAEPALKDLTFDETLSVKWQERAKSLLLENKDVFSQHELDVGETSHVTHRIKVTSEVPFRERARRIPPGDLNDARSHIHDLLDAGIIRDSSSPYASPIVLVRKRDGSIRLTVDYRKLNRLTVKDAYNLPRIEDAFTKLSGAKWFSTMDLRSGFYQVKMHPADREKTAFVSPLGFYEFNRMPQGITNAPATFQRLMENCVGSMNLQQVLAFLDDLIVFSRSLEEHEVALRRVFQRLRKYGLKLSPGKCHFFQRSVRYLGHVISEKGVQTDPEKISVVKDWPRPANMKELKSFLGFAGYYRRFVEKFSAVAKPLNELLHGYTKQNGKGQGRTDHARVRQPFGELWTSGCEQAFNTLRDRLVEAPVLAIADHNLPYELHTDASQLGLGAALYQKHDGVLHPVAFASRATSPSERNYPAHKLEYLALKWSVCDKFHDYLYGSKFRVVTDNNPLTYVMTSAKLDATGHRWLAALSTYDFDIVYAAGKNNTAADSLSRRPHHEAACPDPEYDQQQERIASMLDRAEASSMLIDGRAVAEAVICGSRLHIAEGMPMMGSMLAEVKEVEETCCDLPSIGHDRLAQLQLADPAIARVRYLVQEGIVPKGRQRRKEKREVLTMMRTPQHLVVRNDVLYKRSVLGGGTVYRLVVPICLRATALRGVHDDLGHLGIERAVSLARSRFYWVNMDADIKTYCQQCRNCVMRKAANPRAAPMQSLESSGPMDLVCVDFLSLEPDRSGVRDVLVITDHFTRFARAVPTRNQTTRQVAEVLWKNFFLDFGFPKKLHSDRGGSFTSKLAKELCKLAGVQGSYTTPYHPQGNGQVERFNRTLIDMLGTLDSQDKAQWSQHVKFMAHAYNCTRNDSTSFSPFELMFGRQPRLPVDWYFGLPDSAGGTFTEKGKLQYVKELKSNLDRAYRAASENAHQGESRNKARYDKRVRASVLASGDRVLVRNVGLTGKNKLANHWCAVAYTVTRKLGGDESSVYVVRREDGQGRERTLHRNMLLPCGFLPLAVDEQPAVLPRARPAIRQRTRASGPAARPTQLEEGSSYESSGDERPGVCFSESSSDSDEPVSHLTGVTKTGIGSKHPVGQGVGPASAGSGVQKKTLGVVESANEASMAAGQSEAEVAPDHTPGSRNDMIIEVGGVPEEPVVETVGRPVRTHRPVERFEYYELGQPVLKQLIVMDPETSEWWLVPETSI